MQRITKIGNQYSEIMNKVAQTALPFGLDKPKKVRCVECGRIFDIDSGEISFGPDPYAEDIGGDSTSVWECDSCRHQSGMDI